MTISERDLDELIKAFVIFFATMGPLDNIGAYALLTSGHTPAERRRVALKSVGAAALIIILFRALGDDLLHFFGVGMGEFKIAGGLLLLLAALNMVTAGGGEDFEKSDKGKRDPSIYPLAMPLLAATDALAAIVMQVHRAEGDPMMEIGIIGVALFVNLLVLASFLATGFVIRHIGVNAIDILSRVMGLMLAALAVEFMVEGGHEAGIF